jgi:hypothetical protein
MGGQPAGRRRESRAPLGLTERRMSVLRKLAPAVHRLDHAVGRRLRAERDVLVEMRTPVCKAVLSAVADELAADPAIRVWYTSEYPARIVPIVPHGHFLHHSEIEWRRFDLYLNGDPWAAARLRRCARRINFFHGVAGKYDLDNPAGLPMGFELYDRVAFINRDRMSRYLAAGIVTPRQAALVGYPKLDALVNGGWRGSEIRESFGLDEGHPVVLYAPTYSAASSLHIAGEAIVRALFDAGLSVIVKLHDRSLDPDPRYNDGIDWRARFRALEAPGRVKFVEGCDASPLMAAADALVTDHSSVGFEFLVLDRPLLIYDAPDLARTARINPEKVALLRGAADVVHTTGELIDALQDALRHPARRSHDRRRVASDMFFEPGSATARAVALAYELLGRAWSTDEIPAAAGYETSRS